MVWAFLELHSKEHLYIACVKTEMQPGLFLPLWTVCCCLGELLGIADSQRDSEENRGKDKDIFYFKIWFSKMKIYYGTKIFPFQLF